MFPLRRLGHRRARPAAAVVALAVLLTGCGGDDATVGRPGTDGPATATSPGTAAPAPRETVTHGGQVPPLHPSVDGYPETRVQLIPAAGGPAHVLPVKVADTAARRSHGLMEVPELPAGTGMLFVYEDDHTGGFWMKDTLVPLTIAFVDAAGGIVAVIDMDPCEADPCPTYDPGAAYRSALEVPRGFLQEIGVGEGDRLERLGG